MEPETKTANNAYTIDNAMDVLFEKLDVKYKKHYIIQNFKYREYAKIFQ